MRVTVPSLYVRVYRKLNPSGRIARSSLTVCEGISPFMKKHLPTIYVPSLYVRVYRLLVVIVSYCSSSLTVCEGISAVTKSDNRIHMFPHCM